MDASCKIQGNIHVLLRLIQKSMCPEFWVHITLGPFSYGPEGSRSMLTNFENGVK